MLTTATRIALLTAILLAHAAWASPPEITDLITNGDLTAWQDGRPVGWTVAVAAREGDGATSTLTRWDDGPAGRPALRLEGGPQTQQWLAVSRESIAVKPGDIIAASGAIRMADVAAGGHRYRNCQFAILLFDAEGNRIGYRAVVGGRGSQDWTWGHAGFVVPPAGATIQASVFLSMDGQADFADLSVRCIRPGQPANPDDPADVWRNDLDYLQVALDAIHQSPYGVVSREQFARRLDQLVDQVRARPDAAHDLQLMRIMASLGDGHTSAGLQWRDLSQVPIRLHQFDAAVVVVAADSVHAELIGRRVVKVGGHDLDEVRAAIEPCISHDNPWWLKRAVAQWLTMPEVLHAAGLVAQPDRLVLTVADEQGRQLEAAVPLLTVPSRGRPWGDVLPADGSRPRHLQNRGLYWWEALPDHDAMYIRYVRCRQDRDLPLDRFAAEIAAAIDDQHLSRVVVDLRGNTGGSSNLFHPVLRTLAERRQQGVVTGVSGLIDRDTYSSAVLNALELQQHLGAVLVGEPTGGKPNHFGEVQSVTLPGSGIQVGISGKHFQRVEGDPDALQPDIRVTETLADWRLGRDPVLDAALAGKLTLVR